MVLLKAMFIYILYTIKIHDFSMFVRDFVDFSLSERVFKETWMAFVFLKNIVRCYILRKADVFCVWVKIYWQK